MRCRCWCGEVAWKEATWKTGALEALKRSTIATGDLEASARQAGTWTWTLEDVDRKVGVDVDVDDGRSPRAFALARTRALSIHSEEENNARGAYSLRGTRHDALEPDMALTAA